MNSETYTHILKSGRRFKINANDKWIINKYIFGILTRPNTQYVSCRFDSNRKYAGLLHRILLEITDPKIQIDHINGNGLDCTRENLRICTNAQNQWNRRPSGINPAKGVYWRKDRNVWIAKITVNNQQIRIGQYDNLEDAIKARLEAEEKYHGEFAGFGTLNNSVEF